MRSPKREVDEAKLLTGDEAAAVIGIDPDTFNGLRSCERLAMRLPFVRVGQAEFYREADVLAFKARRDRLLRRA
jgi:hypothetical protein